MDQQLLPEHLERYRRQGFVALPTLAGEQEVSWLRETLLRLFEARAGRARGDHFDMAGIDDDKAPPRLPQLLNPSRYAEELIETPLRSTAQRVAEELLEGRAELDFDHAILKPADGGFETPWHQDEAYWDPAFHYHSLTLWVPLQDADARNGCLQFIPGSHLGPVLTHNTLGRDPRIHALVAEGFDPEDALACPLPAGACSAHHHRTLHYSSPNLTDEPRLAYIYVFRRTPRLRRTRRVFPWLENRKTAAQIREQEALKETGAGEPVHPSRT